jgi:hypothetical protein
MVIYVAGAYNAPTKEGRAANIEKAAQVAAQIWETGNIAICPHLNTQHFEERITLTNEAYVKGDLFILARCDAIVMLQGWEESAGATIERLYASQHGIPIYLHPHIPAGPHQTEKRAPIQAEAFLNTVMRMYRVHLTKNADYSPANILGTGEVGLITRLWDKVARLMNLSGFRFTIEPGSVSFTAPKEPNHESIDDTLMDASVYAIIGMLLRGGKWGV